MTDLDAYLDKFSESGKRILKEALAETRRRDQHFISPEHILYGLINEEPNLFNETMRSISIDPQVFRRAVEKRLENSPEHGGKGFRLSLETVDIFRYSMERAWSQGRRIIDAADMCHVLASNKNSLLDNILQNPEGSIPSFRDGSRIRRVYERNHFHYPPQNKSDSSLIGSFVECDGLLAVVIGFGGEHGIPDGHLALWFGEPQAKRISEGGSGNLTPIVRTVPKEYCLPAKPPEFRH